MIDDEKVKAAKRLLRTAGYYCIPVENVLTLQSESHVKRVDFIKYGDNPNFLDHYLGGLGWDDE